MLCKNNLAPSSSSAKIWATLRNANQRCATRSRNAYLTPPALHHYSNHLLRTWTTLGYRTFTTAIPIQRYWRERLKSTADLKGQEDMEALLVKAFKAAGAASELVADVELSGGAVDGYSEDEEEAEGKKYRSSPTGSGVRGRYFHRGEGSWTRQVALCMDLYQLAGRE